jgi:hypothetical protein
MSRMGKKHYEEIAEIIRSEWSSGCLDPMAYEAIDNISKNLADFFAKNNPKFNRAKFLKLAGVVE